MEAPSVVAREESAILGFPRGATLWGGPTTRGVQTMTTRTRPISATHCHAFVIAAAFVAAGVAAAAPSATASETTAAKSNADLYRDSIIAAAVKRPSYQKKLKPLDASKPRVKMITFHTKRSMPEGDANSVLQTRGIKTIKKTSGGKGEIQYDTWVSIPAESSKACKGAKDPVLALEQILGMPPVAGDWVLDEFEVAPKDIFRPCASSPDITTKQCDLTLPTEFKSKKEKEAVKAAQAFVFVQMWTSFNVDFPKPGYPFTGMGWT